MFVNGLSNFFFRFFVIEGRRLACRSGSSYTAQKIKFSIKYFFSKCDQMHRKLRIWSHLLKKSLVENFIFVQYSYPDLNNKMCNDCCEYIEILKCVWRLQKNRECSLPEVFCKVGVLKNFAKFTGKHRTRVSFLIKMLETCSFMKKETLAQVFSG